MNLNNPPKFYLLLITLIGVFTLMLFGRVATDNAQAWALVGTIVGYGVGNGIAARSDQPVEPVFGARRNAPDAGRIHLDIVLGWVILLGGSIACAMCIAWFTLRLV